MATRKYSNKRKRKVNRFDTGGITPFNASNFGDYGLTPQGNTWTPRSDIQSIIASGDQNAINQLKMEITGDDTSGGSGGLSNLAKGAINGAGALLGQTGYKVISGGLNSGAGNAIMGFGSAAGDIISTVNPVIGGAVKLGSGLVGGITNALFGSKLNQERINNIEGGTNQLNNIQVDDSSTGSILNQFGDTSFGQSFNMKDIGKDGLFSNKAKNTYKRLKKEQATAINRALGNFSNAAGNVQENQVLDSMANYAAYGGPIIMRNTGPMSPFGNTFAEGGICIKPSKRGTFTAAAKKRGKSVQAFASQVLANKDNYSPAMVKKANFARNASKWKHADGGWLDNIHGGIFDNGVITIGNGGTHEQNPYEGIQMGVDEQGIPNLVEEGEVIFNDYVYSNRIKAPKEVKKKYKLRGETFADLAENVQKESEERPFDPISQRGLQDIMTKLAMEQEAIRMKDERKRVNKYAKGGKLGNLFEGPGPDPNFIYNPYAAMNSYGKTTLSGEPLNDAYRTWEGFKWYNPETQSYTPDYSSDATRNAFMALSDADIAKFYNESSLPNFYRRNSTLPTRQEMWDLAHDYNYGDMHKAFGNWLDSYLSSQKSNPMTVYTTRGRIGGDISINPEWVEDYGYKLPDDIVETITDADGNTVNYLSNSILSPKGKKVSKDTDDKGDKKRANLLTYLRYAPILGSAIGLTQGLLSKPDYSNADAVLEASKDAGRYMPVSYKPIGNYLTYIPLDRDYYVNKLAAQAGATRRAITGQSAGNRATAMAGLLASDYNAQTQIGDMMRKAAEYNFERRKDVETFNRATDQFNAEQALKAAMANQDAYARSAASRLSGTAQAMAMKNAIDEARNNSIAANFSNIFQTLGDIGREEVVASWIKDHPALYYDFARNGAGSRYKGGNKNSYGGYITRKNKKKGGKK